MMIELTGRGKLGLMVGTVGMFALGWMVTPVVASAESINEKAKVSLQKAQLGHKRGACRAPAPLSPSDEGSV